MMQTLQQDFRQHANRWLLTALVVAFGLQELRVLLMSFVGYLREAVGISSLNLAPIAIGVFALSFLAGLLNRAAGSRRALWISAGGLALVRVVEQLVSTASLDFYLAVVGVALFLMYVPLAVGLARAEGGSAAGHLGTAFLLGFSVDGAIAIAGKTLDLSWQSGPVALGVVLILAGITLQALRNVAATAGAAQDAAWGASLGLIALGPWILLQLLIFQNLGLISSLTGWETPAAGALLLASNAVGIWLAGALSRQARGAVFALLLGLVLVATLTQMRSANGLLSAAWLAAGIIVSFTVGRALIQGSAEAAGRPGLLRSTVTFGIGQILFVLLLFVYYASYDLTLGVRAGVIPPAAGALVALFLLLGRRDSGAEGAEQVGTSPALMTTILLVVPLAVGLVWKSPQTAQAAGSEVRVLSYNIHNAVDVGGRQDPEAIAQAIEASGADVIALQEVSRGWLIWGNMDVLTWLAQRLEMNYVWAPAADAQLGNALLTRLPITHSEVFPLPPDDVLYLRGYLLAEVQVGEHSLKVIGTHFSALDDQEGERNIQASAILDGWAGAPATVIMGDFNAQPHHEPILILLNGGLVDVAAEIGAQPSYTYHSEDPERQIDYIFVSGDVNARDFEVLQTTASDHLPLAATLLLEP